MSTRPTLFLRLLCCGLLASGLPWAARATAHGDVEGVISAISQEIARNPTVDLLVLRARLHLEHGDHASALMDCARARVQAGDAPAAAAAVARCLGQVLLADGQDDAALAALERSLALQPDDGETLELLAHALRRLDRAAEALRVYDQRVACRPTPQPQFYCDRLATQRVLQRPLAEQLAGLDQGLARLGPLVVLEEAALQSEVDAGLSDAALARLDRLARDAARPESWLVQRGDLLRRLGRHGEAQHAYQAALQAIDRLPLARRHTSATQQLCQRANAHLATLTLESHR
jgi:Flp pilus assembly protein TadD